MITKDNIKSILELLNFKNSTNPHIYTKYFLDHNCELKVDFKNERFIYPINTGADLNKTNGASSTL